VGGRAPSLRVILWHLPCLRKKHGKTSVRVAEECQLAEAEECQMAVLHTYVRYHSSATNAIQSGNKFSHKLSIM